MRLIVYDAEVFKYNWLVVFKDHQSGIYTCVWDDPDTLAACLSDDCIYVGYNSKHYDQYILKAICTGLSAPQIKELSNYIVNEHGQGWQYPLLRDSFFHINNVDMKDDAQKGLSLKAIEGHMGISVKESSISFDIDRPLTEDEKRETEFYCKHDVDATEKLIGLRHDYLKNKVNLGRLAGLDEVKAMGMTNAKLTAAMLKAVKKPHDDERKYVYPDNLLKKYIPQEVFDFFNRMYDRDIPDEELFKSKLEMSIGDCQVTIAYGGIHGAQPHFFWEKSEDRGIWNEDVGSYYPHLCTINGYTSRNIPSPKIYEDILERRMQAKASGDKPTANALKLVCNTTYGCLLNQYNDLYDPLMGRSVCISGQLYLLELAEHCYREIEGLQIVQLNTDGIMVECATKDYDKLKSICDEWQQRTGFSLEEDTIVKIAQKDVNNYVEIQPDGKAKAKGGYLVKGIAPAGAFNINNSCVIVATALKEYFVNGTPVEDTINACDDIFQFQIIAKAGQKYRESYHIVDGEKHSVQKVNRVYATSNTRYGKLYKVKAEDDSEAKIDSLPEHCIIDNDNELSIDDVDRSFYIAMAKKRINDFKGIKPEKTKKPRRTKRMATATKTPPMNVYQKLIEARKRFLDASVEQGGKNMQLQYKYFELSDIVPIITRIFSELGLIAIDRFTDTTASLTIVNTDDPEQGVEFVAPFNQIQPIISNAGKQVTNDMQALGSSITYMRRYLYLIAMDICVADDVEPTIDHNTNASASTPAPSHNTTPVTPQQREETKVALVSTDGPASELQIKGLKNVLIKLKDADPSKEEFVADVAVKTDAFTKISKLQCEELIKEVTKMLEGGQK